MVINDPTTLAEVTEEFQRYEQALMANDVTALDDIFWQSPHTLRYGVGEMLYGFDQIAAFRAGRGGSPQRTLLKTVITSYGQDFATANAEFLREGSNKIGRQSQSWVRTETGWKVVAAHVSLMGEGY